MEKIKTVLNIAKIQNRLGAGVVALLTTGLEQISSSVVFECPCSSPELNFKYSLIFLLAPALALLLLGFILNKNTWKLLTGLCCKDGSCCCRKLLSCNGGCCSCSFSCRERCAVLLQMDCWALLAPTTWIAVALLNGVYYECGKTGVGPSYTEYLCGEKNSSEQCQRDLYMFPCGKGLSEEQKADIDTVLHTLRAESQIWGWVLIASIMGISIMYIYCSRCCSAMSYMQLEFRRAYDEEESRLMDSYATEHARELADRNLKIFFKKMPPQEIQTPSNEEWKKISAVYKFCTEDHLYSTLHCVVEGKTTELDSHMMKESERSATDPKEEQIMLRGGSSSSS